MRPTIKTLQAKIVKIDSEHAKQVRELENRIEHWRAKAGEQALLNAEMELRLEKLCNELGAERLEHRSTKNVIKYSYQLVTERLWKLDGPTNVKRFVHNVLDAMKHGIEEAQ